MFRSSASTTEKITFGLGKKKHHEPQNPDTEKCELEVVKAQLKKPKAFKKGPSSRVFPSLDTPQIDPVKVISVSETGIAVIPSPITLQFNMNTVIRNAALNTRTDNLPPVEEVSPEKRLTVSKTEVSPPPLNQYIHDDMKSKEDKRESDSDCSPKKCCKVM